MANASIGVCFFLALSVVFVVNVQDVSTAKNQLPKYFKICHRNDPDLNGCIRYSIESLRPLLAQGIPELHIPSCEPLVVPQVIVNQGTGPVAITSTYSNVKVYGPSKFQLEKVEMDVEHDRMTFEIFLPYLNMTSHYRLNGHILALPIKGEGMSSGNYTDVSASAIIQGERVEKEDEIYFHVSTFKFKFHIGHAKVVLENLFDGDKALGASMNMFLNENWRSVVKEVEPILEETIGAMFKKFSNKIFDNYPIAQLLPK